MIDLVILFLFILLSGITIARDKTDYLDLKTTVPIRGLMAFFIMMHHFVIRTNEPFLFNSFFWKVGPLCVAIFFFLSGYGAQKKMIESSVTPSAFLKKRLKKLLPSYLLAMIIYYIAWKLMDQGFTTGAFIKSFIDGRPLVSFSWYVIFIMWFYIIFAAEWKMLDNPFKVICASVCVCFIWIAVNQYFLKYPEWWTNYVFAIPTGLVWGTYKDRIDNVLHKNYLVFLIMCIFTYGSILYFSKTMPFKSIYLKSIIIPIILMMLMMRFRLKSRIVTYLGKISYELYIFHGLYIDVLFQHNDAIHNNTVLYIILSVVCSILTASLINTIFKYIRNNYLKT